MTTEQKLRNALARALERIEVCEDTTGAAAEAEMILRGCVDLDGKAAATDNIRKAEQAMGFAADTRINLLDEPMTPAHEDYRQYQRHIAIEWEGGVIWLNMFDFTTSDYAGDYPHFCIDVRQFNSAGQVKGEGVFTMARNMQRGEIKAEAITGQVPQGHGWDGGFVVSILTDPDGQESHTDDERK